jgi:hypothetical protein
MKAALRDYLGLFSQSAKLKPHVPGRSVATTFDMLVNPFMTIAPILKYCAVAAVLVTVLAGCEAPPKSLPATAAGKKISIIDTSNDILIRLYHAQFGAAPMNRDTVLAALAVNANSPFNEQAKRALQATDSTTRERLRASVFKAFSEDVSTSELGTVLAIPVGFTVTPLEPNGSDFKVCIEEICANPYLLKKGVGPYKLELTVTTDKFLLLSAPGGAAKKLESQFDLMGRHGYAVLYADIDRLSNDARYAPTVYASVYRVTLKNTPAYSNPTMDGIYRFTDLADIDITPTP